MMCVISVCDNYDRMMGSEWMEEPNVCLSYFYHHSTIFHRVVEEEKEDINLLSTRVAGVLVKGSIG